MNRVLMARKLAQIAAGASTDQYPVRRTPRGKSLL